MSPAKNLLSLCNLDWNRFPTNLFKKKLSHPNSIKNSWLLSFLLLLTFTGLSHEGQAHEGHLVGDGIDLIWTDHALIGTVDGKAVFADSLSNEFGIRLFLRQGDLTLESVFKKNGSSIGEGILEGNESNSVNPIQNTRTNFILSKIDRENNLLEGTIDDDPWSIKVSFDSMDGNHYVNPVYTVSIGEKKFQFKMEQGQACLGCSSKIAFAILTVKRFLGTW